MSQTRKLAIYLGATYVLLWILTATWGVSDVDRAFDKEFAVGSMSFSANPQKVSIPRIQKMNLKELLDHQNEIPKNGLFRCRTRGIAVAPFVIIDEAGSVWASMGGWGGVRMNLWFFGLNTWWPIKTYWNV